MGHKAKVKCLKHTHSNTFNIYEAFSDDLMHKKITPNVQDFFLLNLAQQAFIIGHNPTLSCLAHKLCLTTKNIILPPAGIISINFDIEKWDDLLTKQGTLLFCIEPGHE